MSGRREFGNPNSKRSKQHRLASLSTSALPTFRQPATSVERRHVDRNSSNNTANNNSTINQNDDPFAPTQHDASMDGLIDKSLLLFVDIQQRDELDERMGFSRYAEGPEKLGWLVNMHPTLVKDSECPNGKDAVDLYFVEEDGGTFKSTVLYEPYFFIKCKEGTEPEVEDFLRRKFEQILLRVERVEKEDLKKPNHLLGHKSLYLKLTFWNTINMMSCRKPLLAAYGRNTRNPDAHETDDIFDSQHRKVSKNSKNPVDYITDLREYDIPYYVRTAIDTEIRVGLWYSVRALAGTIYIEPRSDLVKRPDPVVLAFDIETTKQPLKFPDSQTDSIMMISYMIDGQGFLITNREIVSEDIEDFEYSPTTEYEGLFTIFNEANERDTLSRFFEHIQQIKPHVFVTYNGDSFDWPFIQARAQFHGMDMKAEIGFVKKGEQFAAYNASHMDCFCWVQRDSYLPQGSQGLKAVTTAKLGYNPMELDPEDMTRFASEQPQTLAQYSVSDAVATYYLYMKYVNPFIFSLCNIIPMNPDEVLRRGSGTLCEALLMVQSYKANVIMPNKHRGEYGKFYHGHLLESETYVGGHVEALEAGVFRSDLPTSFHLHADAYDQLISEVDPALQFSLKVEGKIINLDDVVNYGEVKEQITAKLMDLRNKPIRTETPLIYHLDVAAMYPNIILTNRLQPDAIVDESTCASCDFNNGPESSCQRAMDWTWRGEFYPAKKSEYNMIVNQLRMEKAPSQPGRFGAETQNFADLPLFEQEALIKKRLTDYSKRVYTKTIEREQSDRTSVVCQRENPFYVNTVRQFRDRRYEYKVLHKQWKKNLDDALHEGSLTAADEAKKMVIVYDSLQLAHKCILNSFYGYVMRKGARWYSMEMAGIVCLTGARIIQLARARVEKLGRPLELDTDGIWCMLPSTFPENFSFKLNNGKSHTISYPGVMLNHLVHDKFTNHQYQELINGETLEYSIRSENSIFFEVDGPYRAMVLPASTEEDKLLKKRYAVFNDDGSLAELKGFEVKRRGELKLVKTFQSEIFGTFLRGDTLEECYQEVATVANRWLDIPYHKGGGLDDDELFDLISENRSMSKSLEEYGAQKSTSISTAKRLAEFLGENMVKDKGLNCKFVISSRPAGLPVSERAIPVAIFSAEENVKKHFLRKWLRDPILKDFDFRTILDWNYYLDRFGSVIQKIITIPAAMQHIANPVPRVKHPDWLHKRVAARDDNVKQYRITELFSKAKNQEEAYGVDMEDVITPSGNKITRAVPVVHKYSNNATNNNPDEMEAETEGPPSVEVDYSGWLQHQKKKWIRQRKERAHDRSLIERGLRPPRRENHPVNVGSFFKKRTEELLNAKWQVLQIAETDVPGQFRMWALVHGDLHAIQLNVPRVFYINSRVEESVVDRPGVTVEKRVRALPRSHVCHHLYEFMMSETFYQENAGTFANIFTHESVDAVYETQVPPLFRALIHVGCFTSVKKERIKSGKVLEDGFDALSDLKHEKNEGYLARSPLQYLYLYHANTGPRHVFGLFATASNKAVVTIVDPSNNKSSLPNLRRFHADALSSIQIGEDPLFLKHEELDVAVSIVTSEAQAKQQLNAAIRAYHDARRGPTMVLVQSPRSLQQISDGIPLISDFPSAIMPFHSRDHSIPPMDWQRPTCRKMISYLMAADDWIKQQVETSRFADVPFCNVESDPAIFLTDLILARRLTRRDMVLWVSLSRKPDLGGREQDYNVDELNEAAVLEVNVSGSYDTVCAEIEVYQLAKSTLLQSAGMVDGGPDMIDLAMGLNGGTDATAEGQLNAGLSRSLTDESQLSGRTVDELKALVQDWTMQAKRGDTWASTILDQLPRWLSNPESKLYDPSLQALIYGMMRKSYSSVVSDFKRLGSRVVYASFDRLIIATTKHTVPVASSYIEYIIGAISKSFEHLGLVPIQYYESLIWMDLYNWAGAVRPSVVGSEDDETAVLPDSSYKRSNTEETSDRKRDQSDRKSKTKIRNSKPHDSIAGMFDESDDNFAISDDENGRGRQGAQSESESSDSDSSSNNGKSSKSPTPAPIEDDEFGIEAKWNIQDYLPEALQEHFQRTIGTFVYLSTQHRKYVYSQNPLLQLRKRAKVIDDNTKTAADGMAAVGEKHGDSVHTPGKRRGSMNIEEDYDDEHDEMVTYLRNLVGKTLKRQLLDLVPELTKEYAHARMSGDEEMLGAWEFPSLPGSYLDLKKPLLEFVKSVCAVLQLETAVEREVRVLRRDLLNLIGEREFAESSTFANPCEAFRLPNQKMGAPQEISGCVRIVMQSMTRPPLNNNWWI
ncbi:DNA-directed DNA polymerase [Synchytrium endobioticum]|uniref:DNA polymerase epsilon catalytic subunit n=1 Tax=Synchytrium endobioticum TaxID=286115 RepID=A0A507D0S6_9FUNG|nr:DNA-directed DNA polymerase [Synchytrium endobioticum]